MFFRNAAQRYYFVIRTATFPIRTDESGVSRYLTTPQLKLNLEHIFLNTFMQKQI